MDDLLTSNEGGKHDYDWLLTPPETPLNNHPCSAERSEFHPSGRAGRRSNSVSRPALSSRLSKTQAESDIVPNNMRPTRSNSVSRSSFSHWPSSSRYRTSTDNVLTTSSNSVSSYIRSSSPISTGTSTSASNARRSASTTSARRLSTPSSSSSRYSTPSKCRTSSAALSSANCSSIDDGNNKPRSSVRDTLTSPTPTNLLTLKPHINRSSSPSSILSRSRSSTPTRRNSISSVMSAAAGHSISASGRPANGSVLRDIIALDDGPPQNINRTTDQQYIYHSHRAVSAGCRSRPNAAACSSSSVSRRRPSSPTPLVSSSSRPVLARTSVVLEPPNGSSSSSSRSSTISYVPETSGGVGRLVKLGNASPDANGFGRNITKKSLDNIRQNMDVRGGPQRSSTRPVSMMSVAGKVLYPQSIRSISTNKASYGYASSNSSSSVSSSSDNLNLMTTGRLSSDRHCTSDDNGRKHDGSSSSTAFGSPDNIIIRLARKDNHRTETDFNSVNDISTGRSVLVDNIFESSRYDALLLNKEDVQNLNWLHGGVGDDPNLFLFENGFEPLPEPFGLSS